MNKTLNTIAIGAITLYMAVIATDVYEGSTLQDKVHNGVKKLKWVFYSALFCFFYVRRL